MSGAATLLAEIERLGGKVWAEGDRLKFRDTPARLVPAIREHKAALLALLLEREGASARPEPPTGRESALAMIRCGDCKHFLPGEPWPWESLGRCGVTGAGPPSGGSGYKACYPMAPRRCPEYRGTQS